MTIILYFVTKDAKYITYLGTYLKIKISINAYQKYPKRTMNYALLT